MYMCVYVRMFVYIKIFLGIHASNNIMYLFHVIIKNDSQAIYIYINEYNKTRYH